MPSFTTSRLSLLVSFARLVIFVVALSACGGSNGSNSSTTTAPRGSSQARKAEAVFAAYLSARAAGEWGKACSYLTREKRSEFSRIAAHSKRIEGKGCAGLLASVTEELSPSERAALAKAEVTSVRAEGKDAYAIYAAPSGAEYATPMRQEDGSWKVAGIQLRQLSS